MLSLAFSPCPNDTFIFHEIVHKKVPLPEEFTTHYLDIEELNQAALREEFDIVKVSAAIFPSIENNYTLLTSGAALGHACGPKLIGKTNYSSEDIPNLTVAFPGKHTTAYALFSRLFPKPKKAIFCLYHEVEQLILDGKADAGLIIHETRFTFHDQNLKEISDIGQLWEEKMKLPIPLGVIVARTSLGKEYIKQINHAIYESIQLARKTPLEELLPYITAYSRIEQKEVVLNHIDLYVNKETLQLSKIGVEAIQTLTTKNEENRLHLCH